MQRQIQLVYPPKTVAELVGGWPKTIRVTRLVPSTGHATDEEIRCDLTKVWAGKFQSASCETDWAEGTFWRIDATVEFFDGKRSIFLTDGSHVEVQDHDGKYWFLRLLPAAQ